MIIVTFWTDRFVYAENIKILLKLIDFGHVWENKCTFSSAKLIKAIKNKLTTRYNYFILLVINGNYQIKG